MCEHGYEIILDLPDGIATYRKNRTVCVDACIAGVIKHLWSKGYQTLGCCCGHGKCNPSIVISDAYGDVEILALLLELSRIDGREWDLLQWRLTNVNGTFHSCDNEPIHSYFGLSYANYLAIPRSVLQSMPISWQRSFVKLLHQIPEIIDEEWEPEGGYHVQAKNSNGKFVADPYSNYERGRRRLAVKGGE